MTSEHRSPPRRRSKKWVVVAGVALGVLATAAVASLAWGTVSEGRRKARAEAALHAALGQWCSGESLDRVQDTKSGDCFDEFVSRIATAPRPTSYQVSGVSWVRGGAYSVYSVPVTLSFAGGPETRQYEVEVPKKSGKCFIRTTASEDVSGTESHAQAVLRAWLDTWLAGEGMAAFRSRHPEADAELTTDIPWAPLKSEGKTLVRYEVTGVGPRPKGFRFTVAAVLEGRGTPETKVLRYEVYKDRFLSDGRWTVTGI